MKPKLSVVTLTFNNHAELIETLRSLPRGVESVVVNGGHSLETLNFLKNCDSVSISEKDRGISDAFNKGIALASGDTIIHLNSGDILIDEKYFQEAINHLDQHPEIDFVYADLLLRDSFAGEVRISSNDKLPRNPFLHPTLIMRKKVFEEIGNFDERYKVAMDLDLFYRMVKKGYNGFYIPRMVVKMNGDGISSQRFGLAFKEVVIIIFKNRDFSFRSLLYVSTKSLLLILKLLLISIGGGRILGWYRSQVYKTKF